MHESIFSELSLVIAIGAGIALLMRTIRQPLIIGHILTGIIVGPSVLHLVQSAETMEVFANIGIALLLFIIGLGLNPKVIKEVGKVAGIAGIVQVFLTIAIGMGASRVLGYTRTEALFLGIAFSFSSTIIILKLLSDKKEQTRLYGKITVGILLIQDIIACLALVFLSAQTANNGFSITELAALLSRGLLILIPLFFVSNVILPKLHRLIAGSQELLFLFAIGWGFGVAALFEASEFSIEVGALLAGVALASLPYTQEISARLRPLRDFFIIVFFISLGTRLSFGSFGFLLPTIISGSVVVMILKPLIVLVIMGLLGYTKRTSFKAGIATAQISEFSLVFIILANRQGQVSSDLVTVVTFIAIISIAVSTYLILYSEQIFALIEPRLEMFERRRTHFEREQRRQNNLILFGYERGGHEFLKVFESLKKRFVVIDYDPEVIDILERQKIPYLYGDATDIELLEEAGMDKARLVVSTITDFETNIFLVKLLENINSAAVFICHADNVDEAAKLYENGASYVMMPHYIGSEKIGAFIRRNGFKKSEFKRYREKHLQYLQTHYNLEPDTGQ